LLTHICVVIGCIADVLVAVGLRAGIMYHMVSITAMTASITSIDGK